MDTKRLSRAIRVHTDENSIPTIKDTTSFPQKSMASNIDSKVVSSTVALQPRPKRAAFADVSNTKAIAPIQQSNNGFKKVVVQQEKIVKPAASRPALRNAVKEVEVVSTASIATGNKHHEPLGRKVSTKKSTAVYQDKPQASTAGAIRKERSVSIIQQAQNQSTVPLQQVRGVPRQNNGGRFKEQIEEDEEEEEEEAIAHNLVNEDMKVGILESNVDSDGSEPEDDEYEEAEEDNEHSDDECQYDNLSKAKRRSHGGENTTGAITTTLFPKVTSNDKKELAQVKKDFFDADEDDTWDVTMVAEYGDEIFEYMRELEVKMLPNAHYMDHQTEIQWSMRSILMDWIVQVHGRFGLLPETLFLCTNYIDRFLSSKVVSLGKLQLVGATALFVAAKYEEINCPSVHEIEYMVDHGYTSDEILKAERFMLSMLQYELGWPGPMSFLRRISKADDYDLETRTLAKYFLEVTVMDERFVGSPPSFIAAGAHYLSRHMLGKGEWTSAHVFYSGYTAMQLQPLIQTLVECCENPRQHHNSIYEKFADKRHKRASIFVENWMASALGYQ